MEFKDTKQFLKGDLGENLVDNYLRTKNIIPYHPVFNGAHPFDRICASTDKETILIAEVKTKPKRKFYPDTGFDINDYTVYKNIERKYNIPIFIFFVDEAEKKIYGGYLSELEKETTITHNGKSLTYPLKNKNIIYFLREPMKFICSITAKESIELKRLSTRNYKYDT